MKGVSANIKSAFEQERRSLSIFRAKIACIIILFFHPAFFILDYALGAPLDIFLILRSSNFVETAILLLLLRSQHAQRKWGDLYISILFVSVGLTMSLLCYFWTGYESPYYNGLNLVIIGLGVLIPWPFYLSLVTTLLIYLTYLVPMSFHPSATWNLVVTNNYFMKKWIE